PKLKVGILLDSTVIPSWVRDLAVAIQASDHSELMIVVVDGDRRQRQRGFTSKPRLRHGGLSRRIRDRLYRIYEKLVDRYRMYPDAWRPITDATPIDSIPRLQKSAGRASQEELEVLRSTKPDVLLHCGLRAIEPAVLSVPPLGVWSLLEGPATVDHAVPAGYWASLLGHEITRSIMSITRADGRAEVVYESYSSTSRFSAHDAISRCYAKGGQFFLRMLGRLHMLGEQEFLAERRDQVQDGTMGGQELANMPGPLGYFVIVSRAVARKTWLLLDHALFESRWTLRRAQRLNPGKPLQLAERFPNPPALFRADPHVISRDGRHYLFAEEYCFKAEKAHISVQECTQDGKLVGDMVKVLERPYHLSYPFVFERDGDIYMVPESSNNRAIELYRATRFPFEWVYQQDLMSDVDAADTTLLYEQGKWWLFSNIRIREGVSSWDELYLFHSDDFLSGNWVAHPMNPIVSDCRAARPAGAIIRRGGKLIRPSQQSTSRYGAGLNFFEILTLSETDYRERLINKLRPISIGRTQGIHSYAELGDGAIVDENIRRFRFRYSK
ncbi:MAG: hypothetical protein AAF270_08835, partial [Pseudomonadota bacterium]